LGQTDRIQPQDLEVFGQAHACRFRRNNYKAQQPACRSLRDKGAGLKGGHSQYSNVIMDVKLLQSTSSLSPETFSKGLLYKSPRPRIPKVMHHMIPIKATVPEPCPSPRIGLYPCIQCPSLHMKRAIKAINVVPGRISEGIWTVTIGNVGSDGIGGGLTLQNFIRPEIHSVR
jgi:hypothetical protein